MIIDGIIRDADQIVAEKQHALNIANNKEKSLLAESEQMKLEMEKMTILHSGNLSFHKKHIKQLVEGMQSLTSNHDDLQQQLKDVHLEKMLEKVEYEKLLLQVNQCTIVVDLDDDEYNSHQPDHKISMLKKQAFSMIRADRQMANSSELPGYDNVAAAMPKVTHGVSAIFHPLHSVEKEVMQTPETPVTPDDDKVIMTRVMFKDIMT